jgi:membrane protein required for colicin V production
VNWLDLLILIALGISAVKGFFRGFIVEACSLAGVVIGIWAGVHLNEHVAAWLDLDRDKEALTFLIILFAVMVGAYFIGKGLTKVIDVAQLSLPNKLAGVLFGALRSAFMLSILLNVALVLSKHYDRAVPSRDTLKGSALFEPLLAFAPALLPALEGTAWAKRSLEDLRDQVE